MCGHCTSSIFLHEFLNNKAVLESTFEEGHEDFNSINLLHYLFESKRQDLGHVSPTLFLSPWFATCAYLRAGEFLSKDDHTYSEALCSILDGNQPTMFTEGESIENTLIDIGITLPHSSSINDLYNPQTYLNPTRWEEAIGELREWFTFSHQVLDHYYKWWIKGDQLIKNDLNQQMEETGIFDPIDDISQADWDKFYDLIPVLSFSIDVIGQTIPSSRLLRKVALNYPAGVSRFEAFDLWLMRKALKYSFVHCSISELDKLTHPDSLIYLEYAANQQDDAISAKQKISSLKEGLGDEL